MSYTINNVMKDVRVKLIAFSIILVFGMLTSVSAWAATSVGKPTPDKPAKTYPDAFTVTLTAKDASAIYYTTDGSAPSTSSPNSFASSTGQITVDKTMTIKALAVADSTTAAKDGTFPLLKSSVFSGKYTISLPAPTFGLKAGTYKDTQTVSILIPSTVTGATIRYTVDGKNPTLTESTPYSGSFNIAKSTTVKAILVKGDMISKVATVKYSVAFPTPSFGLKPGTFKTTQLLDLRLPANVTGAQIHYTMDGSAPTVESPVYSSTNPPKIAAASVTVKAVLIKDGAVSKAVSATYKVSLPAPTITLKSGTLTDSKPVNITTDTTGTIYYTTDPAVSSTPTITAGVPSGWTAYTVPVQLRASSTALRAVAVVDGVMSKIASAKYTINLSAPVFSTKSGTKLTDVTTIKITAQATLGSDAKIYYSTTPIVGSVVNLDSAGVPASPWTVYPTTGIQLTNPSTTVQAIVVKNGVASKIVSATYTIALPTITASVPATKPYTTPQKVTLSTIAGANIYYTRDGSLPSTSSTQFTVGTPIAINETTVLKAIAVKNGTVQSAVATFAYTINLPSITFTPNGGVVAPGFKVSAAGTGLPSGAVIKFMATATTAPADPVTTTDKLTYTENGSVTVYDNTNRILIPAASAADSLYFVKAVAMYNNVPYSKISAATFTIEQAQPLTIDLASRTIVGPSTSPITAVPTAFTLNSGGTSMTSGTDYNYDLASKKITLTGTGIAKIAGVATGTKDVKITSNNRKYAGEIIITAAPTATIINPGLNAVTKITVVGNTAAASKFWVIATADPDKAVLGTSGIGASIETITIPTTVYASADTVSAYNVIDNQIYKTPTVGTVGALTALTINMSAGTIAGSSAFGTKLDALTVDGTALELTNDYTFASNVATLKGTGYAKIAGLSSGIKPVYAISGGKAYAGTITLNDAPSYIRLQNPGVAAVTKVLATGNTTAGATFRLINGSSSVLGTAGSAATVGELTVSTTFTPGDLKAYLASATNTLSKPITVVVAANPYASWATTTVGLEDTNSPGITVTSPNISWMEGATSFKPTFTMSAPASIDGTDKWVLVKTADINSIVDSISADGVITMNATNATSGRTATVKASLMDSTSTDTRYNTSYALITSTITITVAAGEDATIATGTLGAVGTPTGVQTITDMSDIDDGFTDATNDGKTIAKSKRLKVKIVDGDKFNPAITLTATDDPNVTFKYAVGNQPSSDADFVNLGANIQATLHTDDLIYILAQNKATKLYYTIRVTVLAPAPTADLSTPVSVIQKTSGTYTAGDRITIKFSQPVVKSTVTLAKLANTKLYEGASNATPPIAKIEAVTTAGTTSQEYVITLGTGTTVIAGTTLTIATADVTNADGIVATAAVVFTMP